MTSEAERGRLTVALLQLPDVRRRILRAAKVLRMVRVVETVAVREVMQTALTGTLTGTLWSVVGVRVLSLRGFVSVDVCAGGSVVYVPVFVCPLPTHAIELRAIAQDLQ